MLVFLESYGNFHKIKESLLKRELLMNLSVLNHFSVGDIIPLHTYFETKIRFLVPMLSSFFVGQSITGSFTESPSLCQNSYKYNY